jgi:acetylornithine/N-succinyldiaminopimelate aminotransferase
MVGLPLVRQSAALVARHALAEGLLINAPQPDCLRFTPALTVSRANVDEMLKRLNRAFALAKSKPLEIA